MGDQLIDTGDYVRHNDPSRDLELVVACAHDGRLWWIGWPPGDDRLDNYTLVRKATPEEREKLLREMAATHPEGNGDHRWVHARQRITPTPPKPERTGETLARVAERGCEMVQAQNDQALPIHYSRAGALAALDRAAEIVDSMRPVHTSDEYLEGYAAACQSVKDAILAFKEGR